MKRWLTAVLLAAAVAVPHPAQAAPFSARLGIERLVLDTPPGFADTTDLASPRLNDLAEALTSASNRILIFALTDADMRHFTNGDQLEMKRYMIAVTPKGMERNRVMSEQFSAFVADALRDVGKPVEVPDVLKYLDKQPLGKTNLIGEIKKDASVVTIVQGTRIPSPAAVAPWEDKKSQYLFSTTTLFLVRGKALQLSVYTLYDSPADLDWLKSITQRWVDELLRLNR
jgi:putative ubiquitin-RnfH superfamily antitoxin RatB of RatAB toxin-antitoxin module